SPPSDHALASGLELLAERSSRLAPIIAELRSREGAGRLALPVRQMASSYVHMHCDRMLSGALRAQELVLYDWLARTYESQLACAEKRSNEKSLPADTLRD